MAPVLEWAPSAQFSTLRLGSGYSAVRTALRDAGFVPLLILPVLVISRPFLRMRRLRLRREGTNRSAAGDRTYEAGYRSRFKRNSASPSSARARPRKDLRAAKALAVRSAAILREVSRPTMEG